MAIVKYTNPKTGVQYAYESTACWDPITRRNHPKRTYLGRVDPISGEIIKTEGKHGRKASPKQATPASADTADQYQALLTDLNATHARLQELQVLNKDLLQENQRMHKLLDSISQSIVEFARH